MRTREFLEEIINEQFMPVKATAIELLERMPENEFEDVFIELATLLDMQERLKAEGRQGRTITDIPGDLGLERDMLLQFCNGEEDN